MKCKHAFAALSQVDDTMVSFHLPGTLSYGEAVQRLRGEKSAEVRIAGWVSELASGGRKNQRSSGHWEQM